MTLDKTLNTIDLGYDDMEVHATKNVVLARSNEALQHRLAELLVFEIRQDGETQFKSLSVRGLYKYVLKAIRFSAEKRRAIDPLDTYSEYMLRSRLGGKTNYRRKPLEKRRITDERDDLDLSNSDSDSDVDQKINNLHHRILGRNAVNATNKTTASSRPLMEEKSVSFGGLTEYSSHVVGVPLAIKEELQFNNSSHSSFGVGSPNNRGGQGPVTYRERLGGFLHPRDMRRLVTPFSASNEPELIVRRHVMLLNFDPLRAVILRDRLLVLVPDGADSLLVDLEKRVSGGTRELERSVFGETTTRNTQPEVSPSESNIADSQHSSIADLLEGSNSFKKRASPASSMLQKVKHTANTLLSEKLSGSSAINSFGTENELTMDSPTFDGEPTEFQEWEEMESRGWVDLPFELQCLDAVLGSVCGILGQDSNELQANSMLAMDKLLDQGSGGEEVLRHMKNSVKEMTQRVKGFIRAMNLVLDESEDMALMNLSRLLTHPDRFIQPVSENILNEESDEPELILEAHLQHAFSLTNSLDLVKGEIETTQELINQRLDGVRNRLLLANMIISIGSFCVAIGSFIGSIFGMNVINHMEEDSSAFRQIVIGTCLGMLSMLMLVGLVLWYAGTMPNLRSSFQSSH